MILNNQRGNSLIQVMIATAIMLVVALGTADLISNQNKEVKALTERLQISETKTLLSQILINSSYCSCLFRGRTFNSTTKTWTPAITSLPSSYTNIPAFPAACTASASNLVPPVGTVMPGTGHMKVESINVIGATEVTAGSGHYLSRLEVTFSDTVRLLSGAQVSLSFAVDPILGAPNSHVFLGCSGGGGNPVSLNNCAWTPYSCNPVCGPNKVAAGLRWNPPFNEDCGGGGNDYDEPSRSLNCCDMIY